jgi:hypothetical protein
MQLQSAVILDNRGPLRPKIRRDPPLLARRPDSIFVAPFEQGEIGPDLFCAACDMGLEGLVSKRRDRPYQGGRSKHWVKVKNRQHPAMSRVMETFLMTPTLDKLLAEKQALLERLKGRGYRSRRTR